jgi:tetratricopeptide (TPR) repeat protein
VKKTIIIFFIILSVLISYSEENKDMEKIKRCINYYKNGEIERADFCLRDLYIEMGWLSRIIYFYTIKYDKKYKGDHLKVIPLEYSYNKRIINTINIIEKIKKEKAISFYDIDYINYIIFWSKLLRNHNEIKFKKIINYLKQRLNKKKVNKSRLFFLMAKIYYEYLNDGVKDEQKYEKIIKYLNKSLEFNSTNVYSVFLLMKVISDLSLYKYKKLINDKGYKKVLENKTVKKYFIKNIRKIEILNNLLLELRPDSIYGYFLLGDEHWFITKNYKKAIFYFEKVIEKNPFIPNAYLRIGYIYYTYMKKYKLALNYYKKGYEMRAIGEKRGFYYDFSDPMGLLGLAKVYEKAGEYKEALKLYIEFDKKYPKGVNNICGVKSKIRELKVLMGEEKKSEKENSQRNGYMDIIDTTNSVEFSEEELSSELFKKYDKFCNETGIQIKIWDDHSRILNEIGYVYPKANSIVTSIVTSVMLKREFLKELKNAKVSDNLKGWKRVYGIFFLIIEDKHFSYLIVLDKDYYENPKNKPWITYFINSKYKFLKDKNNRVWIYYKNN